MLSFNKSSKLPYKHVKSLSWYVFLMQKKRMMRVFFSSHRNVSQTLVTFSHYWLIIITISSSSQHVLIQPELRRPTREDRRVPADCRTLVQQTLGSRASARERERRRSVVRFEGLPAAKNTPPPSNPTQWSACVLGFVKTIYGSTWS